MTEHDGQHTTVGTMDARKDTSHGSAAPIADHLGPETETGVAPAGTMRAGEAGSVPSSDQTEWVIEVGSDVIGTCGHKIGEVVAVRDDVIVVEKGFFMPVDFFIPKSAIQRNNEHGLYLNVTKNDALHRGWDVDPASAHAS